MPFVQYMKGGTFGPGMTFKDRIYFENCTFLAQCKFGKGCFFINCKFQKCCPKPYSNPNSVMGEGGYLKGCTLEYVTIPKGCVLYDCTNTGNRVQLQGTTSPPNQSRGGAGEQSLPVTKFNNFDSEKFVDPDGPTKVSTDQAQGYTDTSVEISHSWK